MRKNVPIDVIIPAYNAQTYICDAIESVLNQTVSPKQIFVVNDGSVDDTVSLVKRYKNTMIPVVCFSQKRKGHSAARNAGIRMTKSPYVAFLDADDRWIPSKLEKQYAVFEKTKFSDLGLVYTDYRFINADGDKDGMDAQRFRLDATMRGYVFKNLLFNNKIAGSASAVLIRRVCFDTVGVFDEHLSSFEDFDMWLRISKIYTFDFVPEELVDVRRHGNNMTNNSVVQLEQRLRFYEKWMDDPSVDAPVLLCWYTLSWYSISLRIRNLRPVPWRQLFTLGMKNKGIFFRAFFRLLYDSFQVRFIRKMRHG